MVEPTTLCTASLCHEDKPSSRGGRGRLLPLVLLVATLLCLSACGASTEGDESRAIDATPAQAPLLGAADGVDAADHDCQVVLRNVSRQPGTAGYEVEVIDGIYWFVWTGEIDIATDLVDAGGTPSVMYRNFPYGDWWQVQAFASGEVENGYHKFQFRMAKNTVGPGMSLTALNRTTIELVPLVTLPGGGRLFDHNRNPGDFDNYMLTSNNTWSIADDPGMCQSAQAIEYTDLPDHDCQVVLRDVARLANPDSGIWPETECIDGLCWYVWTGHVDVSDELLSSGGVLYVSYSGGDGQWFETSGEPVDGEVNGYTRHMFRLVRGTVREGMSLSALQNTRIELVPYVVLPQHARVFDHNTTGDFDNYVLSADNEWTIESSAACRVVQEEPVTISFQAGWVQQQHGAVVAGQRLKVEYDPVRLPDCRASYTFAPAWDIEATVRFLPGGQTHSGSVVSFETDEYGRRTDRPHPGYLEVDVPDDATAVEIWFKNWSAMSSPCEAWDSNFGHNYRYEILPSSPAGVEWAGDWGNGFWRGCEHREGLDDPVSIDSYTMQRACMFVDADVYVPGLTDAADTRPEWIMAQVELSIDGGSPTYGWLSFVERVGNNYRFRWTMDREELSRSSWDTIAFAFRFSTDGRSWYRIATGSGPNDIDYRAAIRDF